MLEPRRLLSSAVTTASFNPDASAHQLVYSFDTNVQASLTKTDFDIFDQKRSAPIASAGTSLSYDGAENRATLSFDGVNNPSQWGARVGLLADGNYDAILAAAAVTPNLTADHTLPFFFYQADIVNGDRTVNIDDWTTLAANLGVGNTYSQGDLNYSGAIDLDDFTILATRFGSTLKAPLTSAYGIQVGNQTVSSLTVEWTAPEWPVGQPDGYRIWRSEDGIHFAQLDGVDIPHVSGTNSYAWQDNNLIDGKKYWYRVRAYTHADGSSATTAKAWGVTTLRPPTDVTASIESNGDITVRWNAGSEQAEGYIVKLYTQSPAESLVLVSSHTITDPAQRSLTIENPGAGPFFGTVEAINGSLSLSSAASVPTEAQREPGGPWTGAVDENTLFPGVSVTWDPEEGPYSDDEVTVDVSGLPRHTFVRVFLWTRVGSESPIAPGINFDVEVGTGSFQLLPGQIFSNPNEQFFAHNQTFKTDASSISIKIDAEGLSQGQTWSPVRLWVHTYFPFVELTGGGTVVEDGTGEASFTATRTGLDPNDPAHQPILNEALTVDLEDRSYEVLAPEVKATWGVDFQLAKTITIPSGGVSQTEYVTPVDDPDGEGVLGVEAFRVSVARSGNYFASPPGTQPAVRAGNVEDNVSISLEETTFKFGDPDNGVFEKIVATNGVAFHNYVRVVGEGLHQVSFLQYMNTSTWMTDFNGALATIPFMEALFNVPEGAPFISTNREWVLDWAQLPGGQQGPMQPTAIGHLNQEASQGRTVTDSHTLGPNPHGLHGGFDITYNAGGQRDFRIVFMRSDQNDPQQPLAIFEWGYAWNNNSYVWTAADGAPVAVCASPTRSGAGSAMVTGYGKGTNSFTGFAYQDFID